MPIPDLGRGLEIVFPFDVAVTGDMGTVDKAGFIFVAEGHMFAQRILLVNAIDAGRVMDFGSAIC